MNKKEYKARMLLELVTQNIPLEYTWVAVDGLSESGIKSVYVYNMIPERHSDGWMPPHVRRFDLGYIILMDDINIDFDWSESLISVEELFGD